MEFLASDPLDHTLEALRIFHITALYFGQAGRWQRGWCKTFGAISTLCSVTTRSPGALLCSAQSTRRQHVDIAHHRFPLVGKWIGSNGLDYHLCCLIKLDLASRGYAASQ